MQVLVIERNSKLLQDHYLLSKLLYSKGINVDYKNQNKIENILYSMTKTRLFEL